MFNIKLSRTIKKKRKINVLHSIERLLKDLGPYTMMEVQMGETQNHKASKNYQRPQLSKLEPIILY